MKIYRLYCLLLVLLLFAVSTHAAHWSAPSTTTTYMHLAGTLTIEGDTPRNGDELAIFGEDETLLGVFFFDGTNGNFYGDIAINGDDQLTSEVKEGAYSGELLAIKVWSAEKEKEYASDEVNLFSSTAFAPRYEIGDVPLRFVPNAFKSLSVECQ